jgi:hypothetical protein
VAHACNANHLENGAKRTEIRGQPRKKVSKALPQRTVRHDGAHYTPSYVGDRGKKIIGKSKTLPKKITKARRAGVCLNW